MASPELEAVLDTVRVAPDRAASSPWVGRLARAGLVAKGVSYALVGVLAAALAIQGAGKATSREGALAVLADETYGAAVLVALGLGFAAYAAWRLVQAIFDRDGEGSDSKGIAKRAGYLGRAVVYGGLAYAAFEMLDGTGDGTSQNREARAATAHVLDWPAGRWLVGLAALALVAVGFFNAFRGLTQKFEEKWDTSRMSDAARRWVGRLSALGLLARFVVFGLIGAFLLRAAYQYDPSEAIGLDGALQKVAQAAYGPVLLGIVSVGLLCYAIFCLAEARYRRV